MADSELLKESAKLPPIVVNGGRELLSCPGTEALQSNTMIWCSLASPNLPTSGVAPATTVACLVQQWRDILVRSGAAVRLQQPHTGLAACKRSTKAGERFIMAKSNTRGSGVWMARAMGGLSLGLGLPTLAAPGEMARRIGLRDDSVTRTTLTAIGIRETALGLGILSWPRFAGWIWARVAGDVMDLAILGSALAISDKRRRNPLAVVMAITAGITALDIWTARRLSQRARTAGARLDEQYVDAKRAITISKPRELVYQAWRDFRNLPRFMENLEAVELQEGNRSHWVAKAPAGATAEWDAEMVEDQPNALIAWRSLPGSRVDTAGTVRFADAPGGKGTEIHVEIRYSPPAGRLGATIAKIFGKDAGQQVASDLRRFKQVLETGEIARSDGSARGGPAQPPKESVQIAPVAVLAVPVRS